MKIRDILKEIEMLSDPEETPQVYDPSLYELDHICRLCLGLFMSGVAIAIIVANFPWG